MTSSKNNKLLQQYPLQNSDFELTELDDEIILFSVSQEKAVYLNSTAQLIWNLCDGQYSVKEIIEGLERQYPEERSIGSQVIEVLEKMRLDNVIALNDMPCI